MSDLIYLLNTLLDNKGQILIRGIMEDVASVTDEEVETYKNIDFDVETFRRDIRCQDLISKDDKVPDCSIKLKYL